MKPTTNPNEAAFFKFFTELEKVKEHDRALLLVTNGILELFIEILVKKHCKNHSKISEDRRGFPYSAKLLILNELNVIDDGNYKLLDKLRKVRNDAAHDPLFQLPNNFSACFAFEGMDPPKDLYNICICLVGGFWNSHSATLAPVFLNAKLN